MYAAAGNRTATFLSVAKDAEQQQSPADDHEYATDGRNGAQPPDAGQAQNVEGARKYNDAGQHAVPGIEHRPVGKCAVEDADQQQSQGVVKLVLHGRFERFDPARLRKRGPQGVGAESTDGHPQPAQQGTGN